MAETSKIEWTDSTFNPWIGCTNVSPGCDHCYAEALMDTRHHRVEWGAGKPRVRTSADNWNAPVAWNARPFYQCLDCGARFAAPRRKEGFVTCPGCSKHGGRFVSDEDDASRVKQVRRRVFCASLADVFDNEAPDEWRHDLWELIEETPNIDWLLLTKRIGNVEKMLPRSWLVGDPKANVWLGATVVNQEEADRDIPKLLEVPARVRFLSIEPMLGPVDFRKVPGFNRIGLDLSGWWVIVGGESGPKARPFDVTWARSVVQQCSAAGVACHVKQLGANVRDRNDAGFDADEHTYVEDGSPVHPGAWPSATAIEENPNGYREQYQGAPVRIRLSDRKGGDWAEWPHDLRVRQFPA